MATVTSKAATQNRHTTAVSTDAYIVNFLTEGYTAASTHQVIDIPKGFALVGGYFAVETTFTGFTSLQFKVGSDTLSGAIITAALVAGDVGEFSVGSVTGITTVASYAKAAADTLDVLTVGTLTAGVMVIIPKFIRIDSAVLNP